MRSRAAKYGWTLLAGGLALILLLTYWVSQDEHRESTPEVPTLQRGQLSQLPVSPRNSVDETDRIGKVRRTPIPGNPGSEILGGSTLDSSVAAVRPARPEALLQLPQSGQALSGRPGSWPPALAPNSATGGPSADGRIFNPAPGTGMPAAAVPNPSGARASGSPQSAGGMETLPPPSSSGMQVTSPPPDVVMQVTPPPPGAVMQVTPPPPGAVMQVTPAPPGAVMQM